MQKLDAYFTPLKNADFEIFTFRKESQRSDETVDQYVTRLRKLASTCDLADVDKEIKSVLIQNCSSKRLRRYAFVEADVMLSQLLAKARAFESSEIHAAGMETSLQTSPISDDQAQVISSKPSSAPHHKPLSQSRPPTTPSPQNRCNHWGGSWPHRLRPCPAKGKSCNACGKAKHFALVCRSSKRCFSRPPRQAVKQVSADATPSTNVCYTTCAEEEYLFTVQVKAANTTPIVTVKLNDTPISMTMDTGASLDIIDEPTFDRLKHRVSLQRSTARIFAYGASTQLPILGKLAATMESNQTFHATTVHVVKGQYGCLLSYNSAKALSLIQLHINHVEAKDKHVYKQLIAEFPRIFDGVGVLKDYEVHLHIDSSVTPVVQPARRIPFHLRKKFEQELVVLEQQGIIEKVDGPTPFVSPFVIVPKKDGGVRLCVDMRMANKAIRRERHHKPTIDDLIHSMNGAKVFSKLDLRAGYHQLTLAPESRYITTFATHQGLRRYRKLTFGTCSASEIFQHIIQELLRDIPNVINISDDVIVSGATQTEHDNTLRSVFQRLADKG